MLYVTDIFPYTFYKLKYIGRFNNFNQSSYDKRIKSRIYPLIYS